jgi:membrane-associated phospholipid phosphatase
MITKIKNNLAPIISTIFSPFIIFSFILIFVMFYYYTNFLSNLPNALIGLFFGVVIPGATIIWLYMHKFIKDVHLNNKKDRQIPLLICIVSALSGLIFLLYLGSPQYLLAVIMMLMFNCLCIFLITFFWKISVHAATYSAAVTVVLFVISPFWWFLYLGILIIGWARVYEKRHTWLQIFAGTLLAALVTILVFNSFGFNIFMR